MIVLLLEESPLKTGENTGEVIGVVAVLAHAIDYSKTEYEC